LLWELPQDVADQLVLFLSESRTFILTQLALDLQSSSISDSLSSKRVTSTFRLSVLPQRWATLFKQDCAAEACDLILVHRDGLGGVCLGVSSNRLRSSPRSCWCYRGQFKEARSEKQRLNGESGHLTVIVALTVASVSADVGHGFLDMW